MNQYLELREYMMHLIIKKIKSKIKCKTILSLLYLKMNGYHIFALVDSRDYGCLHNLVDGDMMAVVSFSYHIRVLLQQVY